MYYLICFKFLFTITKGINLYKLADIEKGEVLATQTLIVLFIALIMGYICCFEVTVLEKLLSNKFNIDFSEAPFGMGFLGKPAVGWLYPFTIMFFAWMCYSTVLIIAPINKIIDNVYIKWGITFILIIGLALFQSKFA